MTRSFWGNDPNRILVCFVSVVVGVALAQRDANMTYAGMCRSEYPVYSGVAGSSLFEDVPSTTSGMPIASCPEANLCRKNGCMCLGLVFDAQTNQCIGAGTVTGNSRTLASCNFMADCFRSMIQCFLLLAESSSASTTLSCQIWSSRLHQALVGIAAGIPYNASSLSFSCRQSACYWITPDLAQCNWTTSSVCRTPAPEGYRGTLVLSGTLWDLVLKDPTKVSTLGTTLTNIIELALYYECTIESLRVVDLDSSPRSTYGPEGLAVTFGVMAPRTPSLLDALNQFVGRQDQWIGLVQSLYRNWTGSLGGNLETLRVVGLVELTSGGTPLTSPNSPQGPTTAGSGDACGPACIGILVGIGILAVVAGVLGILYFSTKQRHDERKGRYMVGLDSQEIPSHHVELEERATQASTRQPLPAYA